MTDDATLPGFRSPPADPDATLVPDPTNRLGPAGAAPATAADTTRTDSRAPGVGPAGVLELPGYEVIGELARGGMGRVLAATDLAFGRQVAVKVLLPAPDPAAAATRFVREARITGRLAHPGIPPVHHLGAHADGSPFLAMKLVRGHTLDELLRGRPDPAHDLPRCVGVFEQVCQAVGYAHAEGVVHRDLKPGNVMVGAFGEVQVMDWGLASGKDEFGMRNEESKTWPGPGSGRDSSFLIPHSSLTAVGSVLGTPAYMAPEQARGEKLDARADVFALGGILASILVGRTPFDGGDVQTTLTQAAAGDTSGVRAALDGCPADRELVDVARRCLAPHRDDRPADGTAVAGLVAAYRAGVEARLRAAERDRAAAEAQAAEQRKRRKVQLALAAAVGLLAVGAGAAAWWYDRQESARDQFERDAAAAEFRQLAFREKVERDAAAAEFRQKVEDDQRRQAEQERKARAADTVANLLDRAKAALRAGDADRAAPFLDQADRRAKGDGVPDHAAMLAAYQADLTVLRALDQIDAFRWVPVGGKLPGAAAVNARLAAAFAAYGIAPGTTPPAEAARRVNASPVRETLLAGLDGWLGRDHRPALRDLLAAADPDRFRDEVRAAVAAEDGRALAALAGRAEWADQPPGLVRVFARFDEIPAEVRRNLLLQAVRARPADFALLMDLAGDYATPGRGQSLDAAARYYQAAVAVRPASLPAHYNLGNVLMDKGDLDGAAAGFGTAVRLDPTEAKSHTNLGAVLNSRGDLAGAARCYQEAIRLDPGLAIAHANLGSTLRRQGDPAGAERCYREAVRLDPEHVAARTGLGDVLQIRGDLAGAEECYRAAIRLNPGTVLAHFNLGVVLRRQGDLAGAVACYREAIRLNPTFKEAHFNLGNALAQGDDFDGAVECFREAVRLDPSFTPARSSLALALKYQSARRPVAPPPREVKR